MFFTASGLTIALIENTGLINAKYNDALSGIINTVIHYMVQ